MANMIEAEIMHYHGIPVSITHFLGYMPGDIVVDFSKILCPGSVDIVPTRRKIGYSYRDKEACSPIMSVEHVRKQLQPCVVAVHDQSTARLSFQLG